MLIISYILIVTVLLYLCFKDRLKFHIFIDGLCIAIVVWFGIALWYTPGHYRGWPVEQYPPRMCYVKDYIIIEPIQNDPGAIYVWAISFENQKGKKIYDPRDLLKPDIKPGIVRAYKIPYVKNQHKQLSKYKRRGKKGEKKGKKGDDKGQMLFFDDKKEGFKVVNIQEILKKENE